MRFAKKCVKGFGKGVKIAGKSAKIAGGGLVKVLKILAAGFVCLQYNDIHKERKRVRKQKLEGEEKWDVEDPEWVERGGWYYTKEHDGEEDGL